MCNIFIILGNEKFYYFLSQGIYELWMDMNDFVYQICYVKYFYVDVNDEISKYRISLVGYLGNVGKYVYYSLE